MPITKKETHLDALGHRIHLYTWFPDTSNPAKTKATVIIAHGMGEHAARYDHVASCLAQAGYAVVAPDQRGHGKSIVGEQRGDMGYDGWNETIRDLARINRWSRKTLGYRPHVLLGHSMGAMLSQQYIYLFGHTVDGCILSGSPGFASPWMTLVAEINAAFEAWRADPSQHSERLQKALFGANNTSFGEDGGFAWLSRDSEQVQAYVDDPLCGFVLAVGSLAAMFDGFRRSAAAANIATIPKELPIYVFSGGDDPVHNKTTNLQRMIDAYAATGLCVDSKIYPGGRHEMLNEINRDVVIEDCINWIEELDFEH